MSGSTGSCDLKKQPREILQQLPLIKSTPEIEKWVETCKEYGLKHENECHGILRGWICSIDDCEHMCYGKIGLLEHLFREHDLQELMQRVVVTVREPPSLSDPFQSNSTRNSAMVFVQLDVLKQYLSERYHYAMEKKALRVQLSLANIVLTTTWHHSFSLGSSERLLHFLDTIFGPLRRENIPRPFRDLSLNKKEGL
jgi:hypothetical protein